MPTFLRMAEIMACSMTDFLPYLVLLFYPFRNHLRLKGVPAAFLTFLLSAVVLHHDVQGALGMPAASASFLLQRSAALLLILLISVRAPIWKMLLNTLSVINLSLLIHLAATQAVEPYSLRWFTTALMLQVGLLIPYAINLVKCLGPTLNLSDAPIWKFLWGIPAAVAVAGCAMISSGTATMVATVNLAVATVVSAIAAAAALYLTKTEMITLILRKQKTAAKAQPVADVAQMPDPVQLQYANLQARMAESEHSHKELLLQVMSMEGDLEQQDYEQLRQRLNFMRKLLSATANPSGNSRIDPILTYYTRQALLSSIKIVTSVTLPQWCAVTDEDLAVLIGCLMDHALNACREQTFGTRRIAVATNQSGDLLQIGIKYTYSDSLDSDSEQLNLCRQIAERYHGDLQIIDGDGVAQVVVTLSI